MTAPDLRCNAHVLVLQELRSRFTDSGSPSRTAALDAAISALTARQPVGQEPVGRVMTDFVHWHGKRPALGTDLYAAPPSQAVDHQAALLAEERAHGETIDQRDRYHEVADELAGHIAHITGVDIGEHSSANSPWQNAIEAAEGYKPEQAVEMSPDFTDTARAAIAWVLWHHQGGSSPVGQPLRFALGMGQHDRMTDQQIAEAKRFAAWAGATTEGFHNHKRAPAVSLVPRAMEEAPRDGTMVHLLVQFEENATEDTAAPAWTIGACNDDNVGEDERTGWQFAGWCWTHDHFTEGKGTPVGWLPMIDSQAVRNG